MNVRDERLNGLDNLPARFVLAATRPQGPRRQIIHHLARQPGAPLLVAFGQAGNDLENLPGNFLAILFFFVFARHGRLLLGHQLGRQLVHLIRSPGGIALQQCGQSLFNLLGHAASHLGLLFFRDGHQAQLRRQFIHQRLDQFLLLFVAALKKFGGYSQPHRQQWNQRQQRRVSQRRGAHRTPVAHEVLPHQHPEMKEFLYRVQLRLVHRRHPAFVQQYLRLGPEFLDLRTRVSFHASSV